jgi:hypothetical protein
VCECTESSPNDFTPFSAAVVRRANAELFYCAGRRLTTAYGNSNPRQKFSFWWRTFSTSVEPGVSLHSMVDNFTEGHDFDLNFLRRAATTPIIAADNGTHYIETALSELFSIVRYDEYSLTIRMLAEKEKQADE